MHVTFWVWHVGVIHTRIRRIHTIITATRTHTVRTVARTSTWASLPNPTPTPTLTRTREELVSTSLWLPLQQLLFIVRLASV